MTVVRRLMLLALISAAGPAVAEEPAHWAFLPPGRPAIPAVRDAAWPRNPIDRLLLATLESEGLKPSPEADRRTLIRRLSFDLIGLPPTPEEVEAFVNDAAPDAYEKVVDRLLASPHYGERWAQHWLDLARYADSDGFEFDQARPEMWRYRDWVVSALNADMPYDRFLRLQLAGDEAAPDDPSAFVATGFNRLYPDMVDLNDQGLRRQNALNDITETTGSVVLGLTIGCARCHDHKYDPIKQSDFYALQAFFTPAEFREDEVIVPEEEASRRGGEASFRARGLRETPGRAPPTYLLKRGDYGSKGPEVAPAFPSSLARGETPKIVATNRSSGRRTALVDWLVRADNPLTARVLVNRLWQHHFGRGIVSTPGDFGLVGEEPSHPELLDWLACEFVERGWSLKAMHRVIVTSAAYRQSSGDNPKAREVDPDNALVWRHGRRRLDGEAIRDAMLSVSGRLNPALGGPCVFPELPRELTQLSSKGAIWPVSPRQQDRDRRSLYIFLRRNLRYPLFEAFDKPDTNASCPKRAVTTIAPQALSLLNGDEANRCARSLAERASREAGPKVSSRIDRAYRLAVGRPPREDEARLAQEFLREAEFVDLCLALLNVNEFIYVE